jgi:hypothetical protein
VAQVSKVKRAGSTFAVVEAKPTAQLDRAREVLLVWFKEPSFESPGAPVAATPGAAGKTETAGATPARTTPQDATQAPAPATVQPAPSPSPSTSPPAPAPTPAATPGSQPGEQAGTSDANTAPAAGAPQGPGE